MRCPHCDYMMSSFDAECPRCHGKGLAVVSPPPSAAPVMAHVVAPTTPLGQVTCSRCGAPNLGNAAFCAGCGQQIAVAALPPGAPNTLAPPPNWLAPTQYPMQQPGYPQVVQPQYPQPQYPQPPSQFQPPYQQPPQYLPPYPPSPYPVPPIQNNITVVNKSSSGGWIAALFILLFCPPVGCVAVPLTLFLIIAAVKFTPMIIGILAAIIISKSQIPQDKKLVIALSVFIGSLMLNGLTYKMF